MLLRLGTHAETGGMNGKQNELQGQISATLLELPLLTKTSIKLSVMKLLFTVAHYVN
jgi:hypothetical protein